MSFRLSLIAGLVMAAIASLLFTLTAHATWKSEYAKAPLEVRAWYQNAELTPEAQKRFGFQKCCDQSDVVTTQFRVSKTDSSDQWWWLNGGAWEQVPADIVHWGESAPSGEPTLFVWQGKPTCFFPGSGGI